MKAVREFYAIARAQKAGRFYSAVVAVVAAWSAWRFKRRLARLRIEGVDL